MERVRSWWIAAAGWTLAAVVIPASFGSEPDTARRANRWVQQRPRVLLNTGPDLAPAQTGRSAQGTPGADREGRVVTQQPPAATAYAGVARIKAAYARSLRSRTQADYTGVIDLCQEGMSLGVTQETRKYALRLMSWAHNRRGELLAAGGQDAEALADFETAVHYDKTRWRAFHNRGVSYALQGKYDQAIADFTRTIQLNPRFANAYFNRGEMRYERGELAAAVTDYSKALRLVPDDASALNSRGYTFFRLGKYREAIHDFGEAVRFDPRNAAALTNRGDVFAELGYYAEALRDYQRSLAIDKKLGRTHQSIAWLVATCPDASYRDSELAVKAARRAIALDGEEKPRYLDALAAAYAEAGNFRDAQETIRRAIELAPVRQASPYRARLALYEQQKPFRARPKKIAPISLKRHPPPYRQAARQGRRP